LNRLKNGRTVRDKVFFEILQIIIIQSEPPFEDTIGQTVLPLKQIEHLD